MVLTCMFIFMGDLGHIESDIFYLPILPPVDSHYVHGKFYELVERHMTTRTGNGLPFGKTGQNARWAQHNSPGTPNVSNITHSYMPSLSEKYRTEDIVFDI